MSTKQMTLCDAMEQIIDHQLLRHEKLKDLFNVTLTRSQSSNHFWTFWEFTHGVPQKGVRISHILFGEQHDTATDKANLTLSITDSRITLEQVKEKYSLQLLGMQTGDSLDKITSYESATYWGKLVFGFSEQNRMYLSSVGFSK